MSKLIDRVCKPCEGGTEPLDARSTNEFLGELHHDWNLVNDGYAIERDFVFKAFALTIAFVNTVAFVATNEGHHPEVTFSYGFCRIRYWTTAIDGLSENDFICAAKIDAFAESM